MSGSADGFEVRGLRLREDLRARLQGVREPRKAVVLGLRAAMDLFGAREAAIATMNTERSGAEKVFLAPAGSVWDDRLLGDYLLGARPEIPPQTMLVPVLRRERNWAVLAIRDGARSFADHELHAFFSIAQAVTESVRQLDQLHTRDVRLRIERKIADRQDPKDLIYDILHGLRSLTGYNHSASLWIASERDGPLELVAEQIAWTKARSKRIGLRLELEPGRTADLGRDGVHRYERKHDWTPTHATSPAWLPLVLDYAASSSEPVPPETHMLCAPIVTPDGTLGVLKLSSRAPGILGSYEQALVQDFMPLASLAVQFSVRTETMQARMLQAERKHALAEVTRGIAHDVNNALGAMLPLVQQLREDVQHDRLQRETLAEDLAHVEASIQICRRIFGGMLGDRAGLRALDRPGQPASRHRRRARRAGRRPAPALGRGRARRARRAAARARRADRPDAGRAEPVLERAGRLARRRPA